MSILFEPTVINGMSLANRFVRSATWEGTVRIGVSALVEKVNIDLNRGYNQCWHLSNGDQKRLNKAEERFREFARDWNQARFNKGTLDAAISDVQHVLDKNHLYGRERDALWSDVERLRNMREAYDRHAIGRW